MDNQARKLYQQRSRYNKIQEEVEGMPLPSLAHIGWGLWDDCRTLAEVCGMIAAPEQGI